MGNPALTVYMVTWRRYGLPCVLDFDTEAQALAAAVALAELGRGRTDIHVSAVPYEETEEDQERKRRIWERIRERIEHDAIPEVLR
jgi:hypothetical protein